MRKLALLLAAALIVSAPLIMAMPTLTHAAAKAKKAATKAAPREAKKAAPKESEVDPVEANSRFPRALEDLFRSLATYRYVYDPFGDAEKAGKAGKKAGKRAR